MDNLEGGDVNFKKVGFFLPTSSRGGSELSALEFIDALRFQGIHVYVLMPNKGPLIDELQDRQVPYQTIPYKVWIGVNPSFLIRFLTAIWNIIITYFVSFLIARQRCDLIITNTIDICVGALVAKILGLPHIWYIREFGYEDHGWQFHLGNKLTLWIMNRLSVLFLVNSHAVADKYLNYFPPSKVKVLFQPVSVSSPSIPIIPPPKDKFQITCIIVGVVKKTKRQEDAILAMSELRDQGIKAQLWIVGGGERDYYHFLTKLVHDKKLAERVRFIGQVHNAFPYIQKADVLLMCSRSEAFGRVVVEAMKAGKPVIGSRSGGTVEQIADGFNGLFYKPRDCKELATKIKHLHDHPKLAQKMGKNGLHLALEFFNHERYRKEIAKILSQ